MAAYQLTQSGVVREADDAIIPNDPRNADWQIYQNWLSEGNTPDTAPPPTPVTTFTFLQFMALFTNTEQQALVESTDTQVKLFILMASGAGEVDVTNPEVITGVNYVAQLGLLTSDRATKILSGQAPG